jgi:hypothetical protein
MRMHPQTAMIENSLPEEAAWLLKSLPELTVFPKDKGDLANPASSGALDCRDVCLVADARGATFLLDRRGPTTRSRASVNCDRRRK